MADDGVLPPRFELVREVGAGGTGVVYEAHDQRAGQARSR
jgi:serine/threonine protein kinase